MLQRQTSAAEVSERVSGLTRGVHRGAGQFLWRLTTSLCTSSKIRDCQVVPTESWPDSARPRKTHDAGRTDHAALSMNPTRVVHVAIQQGRPLLPARSGHFRLGHPGFTAATRPSHAQTDLQPFVAKSSLKQALQYAGGDGD